MYMRYFVVFILFVTINILPISAFCKDGNNGLWFFSVTKDEKYGGPVLIEMSWGIRNNPRYYKGTSQYIGGRELISIHIDKDEFEKSYEFCSLSGMAIFNSSNQPDCGWGYHDNQYFFHSFGSGSCSFVCKEKVDLSPSTGTKARTKK